MVVRRILAVMAGAGVLAGGAAAAHAQSPESARAAAVAPLSAQLTVADRHPRQLHGVLLDASKSSGPIAAYVFHYGDGIVEQSYQPLALHGYRNTGTYQAFVVVVAADGRQARSASVSIHVRDGIPPVVKINVPRPNQRMHLGAGGLTFRGRASDAGGVAKVQLAVQLLSSSLHINAGSECVWYDGRQWLLFSGCSTPYFFTAHFRHGRWSFRVPPSARIPRGRYAIRVRGIDRAGNISHYYALRLRTVLPFKLA